MKTNKTILSAMMALALGAVVTSCSDFEEVNTDPLSTGADKIKPYYSLGASIIGAQQDPNIAERLFVINWAAAARQDGEDGYDVSVGRCSDDFAGESWKYEARWLTRVNTAVQLAEDPQGTLTAHEKEFYPNVLQMARIWRVYLMSELTDNFGPVPLDGFQGVNPTFSSEKDVYYWMLEELADAVGKIDLTVEPTSDEAKNDPAYGFDAAKWKAYGISMRMRLAMRLSEADPAKAQSEFEAAVAQGQGITTTDGTFRVQEYPGWDDWTGVMSRSWDRQELSATMANLTTNLGGADPREALKTVVKSTTATDEDGNDVGRYDARMKDAGTYLGVKLEDHWENTTDNPTQQYFFDALPTKVDPRALVYYFLPGDYTNRTKSGVVSAFTNEDGRSPQVQICYKAEDDGSETELARVDATFAWNGLTAGWTKDDKTTTNGIVNGSQTCGKRGYAGTYPALADDYRDSNNQRVFFGPWETYFLLAEAAVRGWNVNTTGEAAYYAGIKASFEYNGLADLYDAYIASNDYNRVGTSVNWNHTTEPVATMMKYINGYTKAEGEILYNYPNANNALYTGNKLNDHLTKIITQAYIANTPWLPLENWSNHRRLGLPFFEIPVASASLTYMPAWKTESYKEPQQPELFYQRMTYPSTLQSSDAAGYRQACSLLKGGNDSSLTPLWWAIGGH